MSASVPVNLRQAALEASALVDGWLVIVRVGPTWRARAFADAYEAVEAFAAILADDPRAARLCAPDGTCVAAWHLPRQSMDRGDRSGHDADDPTLAKARDRHLRLDERDARLASDLRDGLDAIDERGDPLLGRREFEPREVLGRDQ